MQIFGLLSELILFGMGTYLYLFARGLVSIKDKEVAKRAEAFRMQNAGWMRIMGLALAAIMFLNIVLHIKDMLQ
ncbi:MAG: hypothetical protein R2795_05920 [Saprospiraceae bacterium]